jgi:putative addiction module component (TIGR02574 family)
MGFQAILDAVRALPVEEQYRLMDVLQDDLHLPALADELSPEWKAELDRRLADTEANPDDCIPWEQVLAEARARHGK